MKRGPQWILTLPCDCPVGVMEVTEAPSAEEAMQEMYGYSASLRKARERGISATLITFEEYSARYYDKMLSTHECTHEGSR